MEARQAGHEEWFERIKESFSTFHATFAPAFGRKQWRERSEGYVRALLVQCEDRANAENLSEVVDASPRVLQRFLTEARWSDMAVIEQLQAYAAPRLEHPEAVWAVDESGFVKQGKKSAGVGRQYCGTVGKVANCQMGVFLSYNSPRGRLLVDKRLYLPEAWTNAPERCDGAGIPNDVRSYQSKSDLALCMIQQARKWGHLHAKWVTGDDAYGSSPTFRDGVDAEGLLYVLDVPASTPAWPGDVRWETPERKGDHPRGRPPVARPVEGQWQTVEERAQNLKVTAWQAITVAEGAQGPRTYLFACERMRESHESKPGKEVWVLYRKALDGSEPRYYFSNAPIETPIEELARVSASRWPIETEFEDAKGMVGLAEYEVRGWHGWHHHIACCLLANAFLLTVQLDHDTQLDHTAQLDHGDIENEERENKQVEGKKGARMLEADEKTSIPYRARALAQAALDSRRAAAVARGHAVP